MKINLRLRFRDKRMLQELGLDDGESLEFDLDIYKAEDQDIPDLIQNLVSVCVCACGGDPVTGARVAARVRGQAVAGVRQSEDPGQEHDQRPSGQTVPQHQAADAVPRQALARAAMEGHSRLAGGQ